MFTRMALHKRHADLKEDFYARVRAGTRQDAGSLKATPKEVVRLKEALKESGLPRPNPGSERSRWFSRPPLLRSSTGQDVPGNLVPIRRPDGTDSTCSPTPFP